MSLSFNSHDDALNYADKLVEDSVRWLAVHELNIAHRYMRGECELHIQITALANSEQYHLVFRAVPAGNRDGRISRDDMDDSQISAGNGYGANDCVFIGITNLVECPEQESLVNSSKQISIELIYPPQYEDCKHCQQRTRKGIRISPSSGNHAIVCADCCQPHRFTRADCMALREQLEELNSRIGVICIF